MTTIIHTTNSSVHVDDYEESPEGVYHISVRDKSGVEIGYWTKDEIVEDPVPVLGAIFGAIKQGSAGAVHNGRSPGAFRMVVAVDVVAESRAKAKEVLDQLLDHSSDEPGPTDHVLSFHHVKEGFIE